MKSQNPESCQMFPGKVEKKFEIGIILYPLSEQIVPSMKDRVFIKPDMVVQ